MSAIEPISSAQTTATAALMRPDAAISALGLKVGQEVQAKIAALMSETLARLTLPGGLDVQAELPRPLPLGASLTFTVQRDGAGGMMLATTEKAIAQALAAMPQPAQSGHGMTQPRADAALRQTVAAGQLLQAQGQASSPPATPSAAENSAAKPALIALAAPRTLIEQARTLQNPVLQSQVLAQGQTAQAQPSAYLPPSATQMIAKIIALAAAIPVDDNATGQLPARSDSSTGRPQLAQTPLHLLQQSPPKALKEMLALAIREAMPQQDSLAPLYANLSAITTPGQGLAPLPKSVLDAAAALLGLRLDPEAPLPQASATAAAPTKTEALAQNLAKAIAGSGVFLESHLAHGDTAAATAQTDIKAGLLMLKSALTDTKPLNPQQQAAQQLATGQQLPLHERPPLRHTLPQGQPPAQATITPDMSRDVIVATLERQTDAALARITMAQAASLPENRDNVSPVPTQNHVTVVEVPIRLGQDTAIAQMRIERDEEGEPETAKTGPAQPAFTMRFSLEAAPMGPVHAAIRLKGEQVGINIWAENPQTFARFEAHLPELNDALEGASFKVEALNCALGKPGEPELKPNFRPNSGQLLDRSS